MTTPIERKGSSVRDMRGVGTGLGEVNTRNLADRRRKKGECITCGNKTHKIGLFGKRTALTVEGSCLYGRCLLCHPLEGYVQRPPARGGDIAPYPPNNVGGDPYLKQQQQQLQQQQQQQQDINNTNKQRFPQSFVIETERPDDLPDDGTLVSGITMDHRLIVGARNWNGEYREDEIYTQHEESSDEDGGGGGGDHHHHQRGFHSRPTPSVGGEDDIRMMRPPGRSFRNASGEYNMGGSGRPFGPPKRNHPRQASLDMIPQGPNNYHQELLRHDSRKQRFSQQEENEIYYNHNPNNNNNNPTDGNGRRPSHHSELSSTNNSAPRRELSFNNKNNNSSAHRRELSFEPNNNNSSSHHHRELSFEPNNNNNNSSSHRREIRYPTADDIHFTPPVYNNDTNVNEKESKEYNYHPEDRVSDMDRGGGGGWDSSNHNRNNDYRNEEYHHHQVDNYRQGGGGRSQVKDHHWDPNQNSSAQQQQQQHYPPHKHASYSSHSRNRDTEDYYQTSSISKRNLDINMKGTMNGTNSFNEYYNIKPDRSFDRDTQDVVDQGKQFPRSASSRQNNFRMDTSPTSEDSPSGRKLPSRRNLRIDTDDTKRPPLSSRRFVPDDEGIEAVGRVGRPPSSRNQPQQQQDFVPDVARKPPPQEYNHTPPPQEDEIRQKDYAPDAPPNRSTPDVGKEKQYPQERMQQTSNLSIHSIDEVFESLNHSNRGPGFQTLAELVMGLGMEAKMKVEEHNGVQMLVDIMWKDMADASIMQPACELLFALTASSDGYPESDMLVGDSAEGAVDALLITMQTHITLESIQRSGCGILHCLASASSNHPEVPDGTLSGAIFMVVNAMAMHRQSQQVQELGIRALYSQCMLSRHAESNKKNLEQSGRDGGAGMDVIRQAMEIAQADVITVELAARLYWSLASNEDVARQLMESPLVANAIIQTIHIYHNQPTTTTLIQAGYGALANLARVCDDQQIFREADLIGKAAQSLQAFHNNEALCIEACALLGALTADFRNFELFAANDVVNIISNVIQNYDHSSSLQEETLGTLICLVRGSDANKRALLSDNFMSSLVAIMSDRAVSLIIQEMACTLVGSLCVLRDAAQMAVGHEVIDAIISLLLAYPNERKIHEAAFVAMRNITCEGTGVDLFLRNDTSRIILDAMVAATDSVTAQLNACCMLWNICAKAQRDPSAMVSAGAIKQVVKAMQTHMESGDVLEMACGALWCFTDNSDNRKMELLGCGAIDAVTCSLVMHPKEPKTLEKACGLLANVCTLEQMAEAIAETQGISMIVEAMANNSSSMKLLELGALVLRNIVLTKREFAEEASNGISAVIKCMEQNPDAVGFQREACNALWALAAQSEDCKNKILALDGVTVLMSALEHNACVGDVQDAARGAINQLASS